MRWLVDVPRALTQGIRWMRRRPLTALTSTLCLAVGIAAWSIAWTLLDAAILRPFGLTDSNRLVVAWEADPSKGHDLIEVSHLNFLDWQRSSKTLESMAAFGSSHWPALARIGSETVPLATRGVSQSFFSTLGIGPVLGRDFVAADLTEGTVPPVILSHRFWHGRFAGAATAVGQSLFIDGEDHRIVGVMPRGFGYPDDPDVWISVERALGEAFAKTPIDQQRLIGVLEVVGRRGPRVSNDTSPRRTDEHNSHVAGEASTTRSASARRSDAVRRCAPGSTGHPFVDCIGHGGGGSLVCLCQRHRRSTRAHTRTRG